MVLSVGVVEAGAKPLAGAGAGRGRGMAAVTAAAGVGCDKDKDEGAALVLPPGVRRWNTQPRMRRWANRLSGAGRSVPVVPFKVGCRL